VCYFSGVVGDVGRLVVGRLSSSLSSCGYK